MNKRMADLCFILRRHNIRKEVLGGIFNDFIEFFGQDYKLESINELSDNDFLVLKAYCKGYCKALSERALVGDF